MSLSTSNTTVNTVSNLRYSPEFIPCETSSQHGLSTKTDLAFPNFPREVLIHIFSYLDWYDLYKAQFVCKEWNTILQDNVAWRGAFLNKFSTVKFNRVSKSLSWKKELELRAIYLKKWKKGKLNNLSFNSTVGTIDKIFCDFDSSRAVIFNVVQGCGVIADPAKGKVAKHYIRADPNDSKFLTTMDGSKFGLGFGFSDGTVSVIVFSHETRLREPVSFTSHNREPISAVWINPFGSLRSNTIGIPFISGTHEGYIFIWDVAKISLRTWFNVSNNGSIIDILCDGKDTILAADCMGVVNLVKIIEGEATVSYLDPKNSDNDKYSEDDLLAGPSFLEADFVSKVCVLARDKSITRYRIAEGEERKTTKFSLEGCKGRLWCFAMDKTNLNTARESSAPGENARLIAAGFSTGEILVWNMHDSNWTDDEIPILYKIKTPFESLGHHESFKIDLNSLVLVAVSYRNSSMAYNVLNGEPIKAIATRIPRSARVAFTIFDEAIYSCGVFLSTDPSAPHGVICIGNAVQYFDLGVDSKSSKVKKKGIAKASRKKLSSSESPIRNADLLLDIQNELDLMEIHEKEDRVHEKRASSFTGEGLTEEEQLEHAIFLSQLSNRPPSDQDLSTMTDAELQVYLDSVESFDSLGSVDGQQSTGSQGTSQGTSRGPSQEASQETSQIHSQHGSDGDLELYEDSDGDIDWAFSVAVQQSLM